MLLKYRQPIFIFILLVVLAVVLNLPNLRNSPVATTTRRGLFFVIHPVLIFLNKVVSTSETTFNRIVSLRGAQEENSVLKKKLSELSAQLSDSEELRLENQLLRRLIDFKEYNPDGLNLICAEVIGRSPSTWFNAIEIRAGVRNLIKPDRAVISEKGVVGRVVEVSEFGAKVRLITDLQSSLSALNQKSRNLGIVCGELDGSLTFKYVPTHAQMEVGDPLVTSGVSEIFPRGLPIGTISKIEKKDYDIFQKVWVTPAVDFSKLKEVFVVVK